MTVTINGTTGIAGVDGSAGTPAVQGADTNTGMFFPAADTIAFAEGGVEVMRLDSSANLRFNSGYGSVATAYGCRAWISFNGTGTPAIRASGNVSSITDLGTGDYQINFTNSMPDTNFVTVGGFQSTDSTIYNTLSMRNDSNATGSARINYYATAAVDPTYLNFAVFR